MGTRKSRHNKGRKPRYKDHARTTLADISPVEDEGWEAEACAFLEDRQLQYLKARPLPTRGNGFYVPKPDPKLSDEVKRFLERRREIDARRAEADVFPSNWIKAPERAIVPLAKHDDVERVEASRRDVLMELFVERKISAGQIHAGRRWQADKEWATIQPNRSIDWSVSVSRFPYQARGTITEAQWAAMKRRRAFIAQEGIATATLLDFFLEPDRGRAGLMKIFGVTAVQIEAAMDELLTSLCSIFGGGHRAATAYWTN